MSRTTTAPAHSRYGYCMDLAKSSLGWLLANGQTMRWATEKVAIRSIFRSPRLREFAQSAHPGRAVDIGCGGGRYLLDFLVPRFSEVFGIEYNASHVTMARERVTRAGLNARVQIHQGSAENLPFATQSVDFILCTQVLEHVPDRPKALAEIDRILRPHALGIISIPIPPDPCPNPEHIHEVFFPAELDRMIEAAGLRIVGRSYATFAVTRAVAWLVGTTRLPLPINPFCRLEQATARFIPWPYPHTYICLITKEV